MAGKPTYEELEQRVKDLEKEALKQRGPEGELWINEGEEWRSDELSYKAFSMSTIPTAITTLSDDSVLKVNEAFEHLTGYREDEIKGRSLVDLSVWNDPEDRTRVVNDLLEKGAVRNRAIRVRNRSREIRVCLFSAEIIEFGGKQCMLSMAIDETGRQRAEEALRESETRYREIESSIPGVVYQFVLKKDGSYSSPYMSGTASSILDISAAEVMADAHSLFEMIVEEDMDAVNRSIAESARTMNRWLQEFRIRDKAGAIRWIRATSIPHLLPNGEIIWNGVLLDISDRIRAEEALQKAHNDLEKRIEERTAELAKANKDLQAKIIEHKQAEESLRESEEQFSLFMDYLPAIVFIKDKNGKTLYVNKYMNDVLGAKDWIGKSTLELFPKDVAELMIANDKKTMSKGYQEVVEKVPNKNNKINTYQTFKFRINRHGMLPLLGGIALDITKRLETEEALRKSEAKLSRSKKMESMGLLAGGVAHDLNNVLSGIVSYPDLLLMDLPEDSKLRKPIETMQESGQRAAAIVQDLLTVARGVATTKEPLNLNDIVSHYLNSPEFKNLEQFHPTATVTTAIDTDLLNTSGSHVHIRKVVMNLVSNASEAIEGGGNVTISTMNRYVDRPLRGYDDVTIGEYAVLAVSDDGSGISSDDLERIFEPFYTKKVMGRSGTGLGLAVVWNVMQDHKGYIDVISDENGTTFELYFPITRDEISDKALSIPIKDYKGDGETILIVDDVESQREISCKMLDTLGYKTKAVSSGEEAVEYLKKHTVNLLLLDMIMDPGINGHETYERIITIHPHQKAIIVSGFAETDEVKKTQKLGAGKYIKKPVTLEKIGLAIKEELGK